MRSLITLLAIILSSGNMFAQHTPLSRTEQHRSVINCLLTQHESPHAAMRTTTGILGERVIAQSLRDSMNTMLDSVNLSYSPNYWSTYDYNTMIYAYNYPYNTSPVFNNSAGIFGKPQVFFSTLNRWTLNPNTFVYGYYETANATYDTKMNLTTYYDLFADSAIYPNMKYVNAFNSLKNIDSGTASVWSGGTAKDAFRQYYAYNTTGQLTKDSTYAWHLGAWHLASKTIYTYNTASDLTQIDNFTNTTDTSYLLPLVEQYRYVNTYDASHRLLTVYSSYYDGTTLGPYIKDTFAYTGTFNYHTTWKEHQWDPINGYWAPMFYMHKVLNTTTNLPDTVFIDGFDSILNKWIPQTMNVMSYNTSKDPVTLTDYEYNFSYFPIKPSYITHYYYESYYNIVGTKSITAAETSAVIYPNPANNTISIKGLDLPLGSPVTITVVNSLGQIVTRMGAAWADGMQVSVAGLPPGNYYITAHDRNGTVLCHEQLVKQ